MVKHNNLDAKSLHDSFAFESELSLYPLYNALKIKVTQEKREAGYLRELLTTLESNPELLDNPTETLSQARFASFSRLFFSAVYGMDADAGMLAFGVKPFDLNPVVQTSKFTNEYELKSLKYAAGMYTEDLNQLYILRACALILNRFYNQDLELTNPYVFTLLPKSRQLPRYFKPDIKTDYIEIIAKEKVKPLNVEKIQALMKKGFDPEEWLRVINPSQFKFKGISLVQLIDVSESELLSKVRFHLLAKNAITHKDQIEDLEWLLKSFLNIEDLQIGLTAVDYQREIQFADQYKIPYDLLNEWRSGNVNNELYKESNYELTCMSGEWQIMDDLTMEHDPGDPEVELLNKGFRSLVLIPLKDDSGKISGLMEMAASTPKVFNAFHLLKLNEVIPLLEWAVQRRREDVDNRIRTIIKDQYTSLHPSVEWKFVKNAFRYLNAIDSGESEVSIEPVGFDQVYPLYGQADIIGSSGIRNKAIQQDFLENLTALNILVEECINIIDFPLLKQYQFDIHLYLDKLKEGINPDDESNLLSFIRDKMNPVLDQIKGLDPQVDSLVNKYLESINVDHGIITTRRKDFQSSVSRLNERLSSILEKEDEKLQALLPHYFEKFKTDGVHFDIYLGQSLLQNRSFSDAYLKNFRLWQLITMCKITREVELLKKDLPIHMDTAQLILVYNHAINIHFRMDEKRFDVETSDDTQYEMIKKRIDKAHILNTGDRLTQKGKIAIVFTLEKDRKEYAQYMQYLEHEGWLDGQVEELALEEFQGVEGLRAIRFKVNYNHIG